MGLATRPLASYCDADAMYCHGGPTPMVLARMRGSGVSIRPWPCYATIATAVSMHPTLRCHKGIAATTTCAAAACWGVSAMKTRGHSLMPGGMSVGQNGRLDFHITARGTPRWLQCRRHPRPGVRGARRGTLSDSLSRGGCASSSRAHQASPRLAPPHAPRQP